MKCPKCHYLGFDTGDRCRNCGYDFSLLVPPAAGITFGILSLRRREPKPLIAVAGILMNAAFAIFNLLVLSFAG